MSLTYGSGRIAGLGALAVLAVLASASPAAAQSPGATACELQAVVQFDPPGLSLNSTNFTYSIFGTLSSSAGSSAPGCLSTVNGAPTGTQSIDGGNVAVVRVSGTDASGSWYVDYALPQSTGTGSCAQSQSQGTIFAQWPDGTDTVIDYTTTAAGPAWTLTGSVVQSATLNETGSSGTPPTGTPTTYTATTNNPTFPVGTSINGQLGIITVIGDPTCSATTFGGLNGPLEFTRS